MADSDRIVFPDEVEEAKATALDAKAAAADAKKDVGGETNTIEQPPPEHVAVTPRNVIQVPPNCPEGFKRGPDGVCREVW